MCLSLLSAMPRAVLAAPPMQRALAVWAALETNNWARFFALARQATYVEACFLHRLFRGVRGRALRAMAGTFKRSLGGEDVQVGTRGGRGRQGLPSRSTRAFPSGRPVHC
jgi:hypothetical protein